MNSRGWRVFATNIKKDVIQVNLKGELEYKDIRGLEL